MTAKPDPRVKEGADPVTGKVRRRMKKTSKMEEIFRLSGGPRDTIPYIYRTNTRIGGKRDHCPNRFFVESIPCCSK
jgi:hypothetical protein